MKASEYLEKAGNRLEMFVHPLNLQTLKSFLDGFTSGYLLTKDNLQFSDKVDAWITIIKLRGWKVNSFGIEKEMREKGKSDREIMYESLQIEIEMWKLLEALS